MEDIIAYDSYTGTRFVMSKTRIETLRKNFETINEQLKDFCIKDELKKPFLQKFYEMKGRGLVTCRSSYFFKENCYVKS